MTQKSTYQILALSALAFTTQVFAIDSFSGTLTDDIYYPNGVLLEGAESSAAGKAEVTLEGSGSLTIGNQSGGGFPRVSVAGGTKISSSRNDTSTTWLGQFTAPGSTRKPEANKISFSGGNHSGNTPESIVSYTWGLADETFTFAPAARVVLPVNVPDGQKLWVAYPTSGDNWGIQEGDFCIVDSSLCYFEVGAVNSLTLVKESFGTCPSGSIANGSRGGIPNCIITCDRGFVLGDDANSCIEGDNFLDDSDNAFVDETTNIDDFDQNPGEEIVLPEKEYNFMPGHFRYRDSGQRGKNLLDENGLTQDELAATRHTNTSFLSRNPRTAKEQLDIKNAGKNKDKSKNEGDFVSYLIQMRNSFGTGNTNNDVIALSSDSEEINNDTKTNTNLHASAGKLLPSTGGPSVFFIIAIVGFLLMMFSGARRRG